MSSWVSNAPEHKGKMHQSKSVRKLDTTVQSDYLKRRLKQDDSAAVNMSDNRLGGGIRDFTKA